MISARFETAPKPIIRTNRRFGMDTMHLFDTHADEEKAICGADVHIDHLTGMEEYLERRKDELPVGNVCEPCKVHAVPLVENRTLELKADAAGLEIRADELERMATGCRADRDAVRYRNSAEGRRAEAAELEVEAGEWRWLVKRLNGETSLDVRGC